MLGGNLALVPHCRCGHCKKLAPVYEKVAEHFHRADPQKAYIGRVDATAHPGLANPFDIKGYPTLVLLRGGQRVAEYSGERTFNGLVSFVDGHLSGRAPSAPPGPSAPKIGGTRSKEVPSRSKRGAAGHYLRAKQALMWLFTEADPMQVALAALGCAVGLGGCLVVALMALTTPSTR